MELIFWSYFNSKMELNVTPYRSYILAGVEITLYTGLIQLPLRVIWGSNFNSTGGVRITHCLGVKLTLLQEFFLLFFGSY